VGDVTRKVDIRRRRTRRQKRRKQLLRALREALAKGKTHPDRVKIAQEFFAARSAAA
jgi:hypothetical protein